VNLNNISNVDCFIGGGFNNTAGGFISTVCGGQANRATANNTTISGGLYNTGLGVLGTIGGGESNRASGFAATVPGGFANDAAGSFSFAAGRRAMANHAGTFVWGDSQAADFVSTGNDQFLIRAQGGIGVNMTSPQAPLHVTGGGDASLASGGNIISGSVLGPNIVIDNNEIIARNNGATSPLYINSPGGTVAINGGLADPSFALQVNGAAAKPGGGSWSTTSDARLKDVGQPFTRGLEAIDKIEPRHYRYQRGNPLDLPSDREYVGLIAQEVQKAIPEAIEPNKTGYLQINNDPVLWTMLNAIKELKAENDELKTKAARVEAMEKELAEIRAAIKQMAERR